MTPHLLTRDGQRITTNPTTVADLCASLRDRGVVFGPTWKDFKQGLDTLALIYGWTDVTPFASIEVGIAQLGIGTMAGEVDDDGIVIKERR